MYPDPTFVRDNYVKVSLNDLEDDLITAWCNYRGNTQKAVLIRELILEAAMRDLGLDANGNRSQSERPQMQLLSNF